MKIKDINDKYFGKDSSKRYLTKALRQCTENLVATEVALRLHDEIKAKHRCPNNERTIASCSYCENYKILVDAYLDAAYLSARLIFAQKHNALASDFINDLQALDKCCVEQYYHDFYDFEFTDNGELEELQEQAKTSASDIKTKYKTIKDYQKYKFHQPIDQVVSTPTKTVKDFGGLKLDVIENKSKYSSNIKALLDMLVSLANLIDRYSHLVSLPNTNWRIPIKRTVESMILLFGVDITQEKQDEIISETEKFIEPINKMLNCDTGLKNYESLQFKRIENHLPAKTKKVQ